MSSAQGSQDFRPRYGAKKEKALRECTFIAWDGEGVNVRGPGKKQSYVLFGCSTGERIIAPVDAPYRHLHTRKLLDFIIGVGQRNPGASHVGFAFSYDSNMLVQSLSNNLLARLHENGHCHLKFDSEQGSVSYYIEFRPGKWFRVSREDHTGRWSVKIEDTWSFFATSFIKAYQDLCGSVPEEITSGKAGRKNFTIDDLPAIERYWEIEIRMMRELIEKLRDHLWSAGITVRNWYGPGALASFVLKREGIDSWMEAQPDVVRNAAAYAYAGGRFELFRLGRAGGDLNPLERIYAVDINSAYPFAISQLPSLSGGRWEDTPAGEGPISAVEFAMYRIRIHPTGTGAFFTAPAPLFHRDKMGRISFPWKLEGWYWAPEVYEAMTAMQSGAHSQGGHLEIMEGKRFVPSNQNSHHLPYAWVADMYGLRQKWKEQGNPSQLALKLCMNSLYGKMAQRVGWNEEKKLPPKWHQLEWAGWVTSLTRATLYRVISQLPEGSVIATETDAIYTTSNKVLNLVDVGTQLGGWGLDIYDEVIYLQSGLAFLRKGETWYTKRRGLDEGSFSLDDCRAYAKSLRARDRGWPPYIGESTRFVGLGTAIASSAPTRVRHCVWYTARRDINIGEIGKRFHIPGNCQSCHEDRTAYEGMHDLSIRSNSFGDRYSRPHSLPWAPFDQERPQAADDIGEEHCS